MSILNSFEYNHTLAGELDKKAVQEAVTGFLVDPNMKAKFIGTKTVMIPYSDTHGLGDYDRHTGYAKGAVHIGNDPFTLEMDRGISFQIDRQDMDETGVKEGMPAYMSKFVSEHVVPEVDAYVLSKLAGVAKSNDNLVSLPEGSTLADAVLKVFTEAVGKVQRKVGFRKELVAFVDWDFWTALNNSPDISRVMVASNFKHGDLNITVKKLNGVAIIPVEDDRMKTSYVFHPASPDGSDQGGFEPMENAENIGLLVMPKDGASLIKKTEDTRIFTPQQNLNADAWKGDYRIYYGVVVRRSQIPGISAYTYKPNN